MDGGAGIQTKKKAPEPGMAFGGADKEEVTAMPLASENAHIVQNGRVYEVVPRHVLEALAFADRLTVEFPAPGERGWATADRRNPRESGLAAWFEGGAA